MTNDTQKTLINDPLQMMPGEVKPKTSPKSDFIASINLPSKFKPYPFNELKARPLTVSEVKLLRAAMVSGDTDSTDITNALSPAFSENLETLTQGDFWTVLAWLRINTFRNTPYVMSWMCPSCNKNSEKILDIQKLNLVELPSEYKEPALLDLPGLGKEVKVRLKRVGDEKRVKDYITIMSEDGETYDEKEEWLVGLATTLCGFNGLHEAVEFLGKLKDPGDLFLIEQFDIQFAHGLPVSVSHTCTNKTTGGKECGYVNEHVRLNFRLIDIFPNRYDPNDFRKAVRFGDDG